MSANLVLDKCLRDLHPNDFYDDLLLQSFTRRYSDEMDPFSIAATCVGAVETVGKLSIQISEFVSSVRAARRNLEAVSRELASLSICLVFLRDDSQNVTFADGLCETVKSCDQVANEISEILEELQRSSLARVQWTIAKRDTINKLRSSLESHKACIDIALDMASL